MNDLHDQVLEMFESGQSLAYIGDKLRMRIDQVEIVLREEFITLGRIAEKARDAGILKKSNTPETVH